MPKDIFFRNQFMIAFVRVEVNRGATSAGRYLQLLSINRDRSHSFPSLPTDKDSVNLFNESVSRFPVRSILCRQRTMAQFHQRFVVPDSRNNSIVWATTNYPHHVTHELYVSPKGHPGSQSHRCFVHQGTQVTG